MTCIQLHVMAEGHTELAFVKKVLAPHLRGFNVLADARLIANKMRQNKYRQGGLVRYKDAKRDLLFWMKEDVSAECRFTTMFDLYALPNDFPDRINAKKENDPYKKVKMLENALQCDISEPRFIPYIQLHEFEALILTDAGKLNLEYLEHDIPIKRLIAMVGDGNPELIDEGPETAPSKRILKEIPEYDKANAGVLVAEKIGLSTIRKKCPHFAAWLSQLENLTRI